MDVMPTAVRIGKDFISLKDRHLISAKIAMLIDPDYEDVASAQVGKLQGEPFQLLADF